MGINPRNQQGKHDTQHTTNRSVHAYFPIAKHTTSSDICSYLSQKAAVGETIEMTKGLRVAKTPQITQIKYAITRTILTTSMYIQYIYMYIYINVSVYVSVTYIIYKVIYAITRTILTTSMYIQYIYMYIYI